MRRRIDWPLVAALLLFAITLAVTTLRSVRATDGHFVYALDDAYIQMSIGKNLAGHGVWGVTRYEFSGSGSSLLWPLLLAGGQRLFGRHDLFPLVLNTLAAVLLLAIASSILRRHQVVPVLRFAALVLIVLGLPLAVIVLIGMEHTLQSAVALAVAALAARVRVESGAAHRFFIRMVTLSALLLAVRYDLAAILAPALIAIARPMGARKTAAVIGCSLAPGLVYAIVAWRHDWPPLPVPVLLKQALHAIDLSTWHGWIDVAGNIAGEQVLSSPPLLVLILLGLVCLFASSGDERGRGAASRVLLCIFLAASLLHAQFGRVDFWLFRYHAHLIALGIVAVMSGFAQAMSRRRHPPRLGAVASGVAIAALVVYPLGRQGYLAQHRAVESAAYVYRGPLQAGRFFAKYPPRGSVVLDSALGVFTYFSDARVLDLEGLANIEVARTLLANPGRDFDVETVRRLASAHDARISVVSPPFPLPEWTCVSQWQDEAHRLVLLAVSPDEAESLEAHLAAFDGELPSAVRREPCTRPNPVP